MEGMYINGLIRHNLISLVTDGINVYSKAFSDQSSGFILDKEKHLRDLNNLKSLLEYLQEGNDLPR